MVGVTEVVTRRFLGVTNLLLPKDFDEVSAGDDVATILGVSNFDRVKVSFPVIAPLTGTICPVNPILRKRLLKRSKPEKIKQDPYRDGWIFGIIGEVDIPFKKLMSPEEYRLYLKSLAIEDPKSLYTFGG
jgi:glycine cleavage system H lipoate-binding protein